MLLSFVVRSIIQVHRKMILSKASAQCRLTTYALIMEKLETVDIRALKHVNIGHLTNNVSSDIIRIHIFIITCRYIVIGPILLLIFTLVLLLEIGVYSLAGVSMVGLLLGLTIVIGKIIAKATQTKLRLSSMRNKEMAFAMEGIRSVKFNCWEPVIQDRINSLKKSENRSVFILNALQSLSDGLYKVIPSISAFIIIFLYNSLREQNMSLENVFFVLSIFNILSHPLKSFFSAYTSLQQVLVSLERIQRLLGLPDFTNKAFSTDLRKGQVHFVNCSSSYEEPDFYHSCLRSLTHKVDSDHSQHLAESEFALILPNKQTHSNTSLEISIWIFDQGLW